MIVILLVLILSPVISDGYEMIWGTNFPNENGYGYFGNELYLPTQEWEIDLRGVTLQNTTSPDWFMVKNGLLEARDLDCSSQLDTTGVGVLWKSKIIELDSNKTYFADFSLETTDTWDMSSLSLKDFVRIGYYDDNQNYELFYENNGDANKVKISGQISNTSQCQLLVEVDCSADNEIFKLREVNLYSETNLGNSSDLLITKLCSPEGLNYDDRYIQITNIGDRLIDLSNFNLDSIHSNSVIFTWELSGIILARQSLVIGDNDASGSFCNIGYGDWSSRSRFWAGIPSDNDGAQIVSNDSREIIDKVVGINFYEGYARRKSSNLIASEETDSDSWDFYSANSAADSNPGEFVIDETLPVSLFSTEFAWNDTGCLFNWTSYGESNLIGYNLYFAESSRLEDAMKVNAHFIPAQNSILSNNYSFSLEELDSSGYLWLEIMSMEQANFFSQPFTFTYSSIESSDVIEINEKARVTIFPNPTSSTSFLKVKNQENPIQEISVFNIKGQLIASVKPKTNTDIYDIHNITDKLSSGIYFVSAKFKEETVTKKLILAK